MIPSRPGRSWRFTIVAACAVLAGCHHAAHGPTAAGPPPVTVAYPLQKKVIDYADYTGRTAAVDAVQVRARVSGYLEKIHFKDGADVDAGAVLYQIDPRPYQAALDQAKAQVTLQEANYKYQEAVYQRDVWLYGKDAVAKQELQQALEARNTAMAQVTAAKANLEVARLNLEWTKVTSPIRGRLSRTLITRGNLVVADQTVLTTVVSEDPMYVYFDVDETTVLQVQQLVREGKFGKTTKNGMGWPVELGLATETDYPHQGTVDFSNNELAPGTATLQVRAVFKNPKPPVGRRLLAPGMFVRVRVPVSPPAAALLIVQGAIGTDQNLHYVYVVDDQNKVVRKDVELGSMHAGLQAVTKGLTTGERVIVNGVQRVKPGMVVVPTIEPMPVPRPEALRQTVAVHIPRPVPPAKHR